MSRSLSAFVTSIDGGSVILARSVFARSPEVVESGQLHWIEETLKGISQLNNYNFVHCTLYMTNVAADHSGRVRLDNFGQCQSMEHGIARIGRRHYKYSAPETMMMPRQSAHKQTEHKMNIDCFAVGVMAWELATGIRAFTNSEEASNSPITDHNISLYHRKMYMLSQL
jgi:hypothetical protein